jgi:hypothetical protein
LQSVVRRKSTFSAMRRRTSRAFVSKDLHR